MNSNSNGQEMTKDRQTSSFDFVQIVIFAIVFAASTYFLTNFFSEVLFDDSNNRSSDISLISGESVEYREYMDIATEMLDGAVDNKQITDGIAVLEKAEEAAVSLDGQARSRYAIISSYRRINPEMSVELSKDTISAGLNTGYFAVLPYINIGRIYNESQDLDFAKEIIFTGKDFEEFNSSGDIDLAFREMYEEATIIRPDAVADLRVAEWFALELRKLKEGGGQVNEGVENGMLSIIENRYNRSRRDLEARIEQKRDTYVTYESLLRMAIVASHMYFVDETLIGDPEELFKRSKQTIFSSATLPSDRHLALMNLYHSIFLNDAYGTERSVEIRGLLDKVSTAHVDDDEFFRNLANHTDGYLYEGVLSLSEVDEQFKQFLKTSGWDL